MLWTGSLVVCAYAMTVDAAEHDAARGHEDHSSQAAPEAGQPQESELRHVPPDPPRHVMRDMSETEMTALMDMDDSAAVSLLLVDSFEWRSTDGHDAVFWDARGWYGNDDHKFWIESEGERVAGDTSARTELLWDALVDPWWSMRAGVRHDVGVGPSRTWAAFGIQGMAPYWLDLEVTAYVGEQGRTAVRLSGQYEVRLTQRLILQPRFELNAFGKNDGRNEIGSGLANTELALRVRFEVRRDFAPYVGLAWTRLYGNTSQIARAALRDTSETQWLAGVRWWF